jgi:hypothetical protein
MVPIRILEDDSPKMTSKDISFSKIDDFCIDGIIIARINTFKYPKFFTIFKTADHFGFHITRCTILKKKIRDLGVDSIERRFLGSSFNSIKDALVKIKIEAKNNNSEIFYFNTWTAAVSYFKTELF